MRQKLFYEWAGRASEGAGGTAPCMCADACRFRYLHLYLTHAALVPGGNLAYFASMSLDDLREWCDMAPVADEARDAMVDEMLEPFDAQDEAVSRINDESRAVGGKRPDALDEFRTLLGKAKAGDMDAAAELADFDINKLYDDDKSKYRDLLRQAEELGIDTGIVIDAILDGIRRSLEAP